MPKLGVMQPMLGCQLVTCGDRAILFGQPPEVLKSLLQSKPGTLEAIVLPDVRERSGVLLNNLEFLLYYFLFFEGGLQQGRKLKLIGDRKQVRQILELLRLTLLGPNHSEYQGWRTDPMLSEEWLNASEFFALKHPDGRVRQADSFFEVYYLGRKPVEIGDYSILRIGKDQFEVSSGRQLVRVDLNNDTALEPPYRVISDYIPSGMVKFGVEVLGGASGFSPEQPSTGFALCFNGHYILIDSIPYVEHHLRARGISRNQISALFLTHLHDDHCNMFPLMMMPRRLDVITTREIFEMAVSKLSLGLGWSREVVAEHFNFVELKIGEVLTYYGMEVQPHHTVHSIPTVGAVFRVKHRGRMREICCVGDIQTFREIGQMRKQNLVRAETEQRLHELYQARFDLLIADGGMGPIHGDPADALTSQAERVVFVHVEQLPDQFNATFSLANAGKRYTVLEGDSDIYTTRTIEILMNNFPIHMSDRWLSTLFADKAIKRYNTDDVIIKQGSETWGSVFIILSGYCEVIHHDGSRFVNLATREAGDLMGEMAIVTGSNVRNASVIARTPVMVCEFSEEVFDAFVQAEGLKSKLMSAWNRRDLIARLPQFSGLSTAVLDALCFASESREFERGKALGMPDRSAARAPQKKWSLLCSGSLREKGSRVHHGPGYEFGAYRPFAPPRALPLVVEDDCMILTFNMAKIVRLIKEMPQLNYTLRKLRIEQGGRNPHIDWLLQGVEPLRKSL